MDRRKADSKDETNDTTQQANDLYLGLLAIQNAANNEHDEDDPAPPRHPRQIQPRPLPPTAPETKDPAPTQIPTPPAP